MYDTGEGLEVLLIFVGMSTPIIAICVYLYFKKRLEHKQIMAAIEKGVPLSTITPVQPPKPASQGWIKNLTSGITLLIIAAGLVFITFAHRNTCSEFGDTFEYFEHIGSGKLIVALILFAVGISRLIRGFLQRGAEKQYHTPTLPEKS